MLAVSCCPSPRYTVVRAEPVRMTNNRSGRTITATGLYQNSNCAKTTKAGAKTNRTRTGISGRNQMNLNAGCIYVALLSSILLIFAGPVPAQPPTMLWSDAVGPLSGQKDHAKTCVSLL